jgi:NTE family protein
MSILAFTLCMGLASPLQEQAETVPQQRPRVGLVLAGGGARGAAHIGVLRFLEEQRVQVDFVVGTSMGAIVGGLYSAGMSPDEIETVLSQTDWLKLFDDDPPREQMSWRRKIDDIGLLVDLEMGVSSEGIQLPSGLIQGQKIGPLFRSLTLRGLGGEDFDQLRLPFRAVAMDVVSGETVALARGDLAQALRASMSIAGVFAPVEIDGRLLVDGGYVDNMPVDVAQALGADVVIAVDVGTPPVREMNKLSSFLLVNMQVLDLVVAAGRAETRALLDDDDVLIVPDLGDISVADFAAGKDAVPLGYQAAAAEGEALARLSVDDVAWSAYLARQRAPAWQPPLLLSVSLENESSIATSRLESLLDMRAGTVLDAKTVKGDLERLAGLGIFESVDFRLHPREGGADLVYSVREKAWGPNYLRFGMALNEDFHGHSSYELGFGVIVAPLNSTGAEWRTEVHVGSRFGVATELYQPLDESMHWFLAPHAALIRRSLDIDDGPGPSEEYTVDRNGVGLDFGRVLGVSGEARIGIELWKGDIDADSSVTLPDEGRYTDVGYLASLRWDTLDDRDFPAHGVVGGLSGFLAREDLGADQDSERLLAELGGYTTWTGVTGSLGFELGTSVGSDLPLQQEFLLGGFGRLSGIAPNSLAGDQLFLLRAATYKKLGGSLFQTYAGLSLETGNVWDVRESASASDLEVSASVYFGADTPLGPFVIGYGVADEGRSSAFMLLGRRL